jgi:tagatose-1,6-bisphosphate aldolase non-catalytic subunit AgaZ/GatZ
MSSLVERAVAVAAAAELGTAHARKTGRDARWPYVPVVILPGGQQQQLRSLAYATRAEALDAAERHLERFRADLVERLVQPRQRALRRHYGLPAELDR